MMMMMLMMLMMMMMNYTYHDEILRDKRQENIN